jgi:hypothetical protein
MRQQKDIEDDIRKVSIGLRTKVASLPPNAKADLEAHFAQLATLYAELYSLMGTGPRWTAVWPHGGQP